MNDIVEFKIGYLKKQSYTNNLIGLEQKPEESRTALSIKAKLKRLKS